MGKNVTNPEFAADLFEMDTHSVYHRGYKHAKRKRASKTILNASKSLDENVLSLTTFVLL